MKVILVFLVFVILILVSDVLEFIDLDFLFRIVEYELILVEFFVLW